MMQSSSSLPAKRALPGRPMRPVALTDTQQQELRQARDTHPKPDVRHQMRCGRTVIASAPRTNRRVLTPLKQVPLCEL